MDMPVDVKKVLEYAKAVEEARNIAVNAVVLADRTAPEALVAHVETAFEPLSPGASVHYDDLGRAPYDSTTDFVVIVAGGDTRAGQAAHYVRAAGTPCMVVASSYDFVNAKAIESGYAIPNGDLLDGSAPDGLDEAMGRWVLAVGKNKKLAIAQAFAFARRPLAVESIKATSIQNAGIGAVALIPGADMPVMTLNQIKMLLQIAAAFGQPLDAGRIKELAAVVGGGFAARAVARQVVGLVPVGGWAVKGGIGYSGTLAMGYAALNYFEGGGGMSGLGAIAKNAGDKAVKGAKGLGSVLGRSKGKVSESAPVKASAAAVGTVAGVASGAAKKIASGAGLVVGAVKGVGSRILPSKRKKADSAEVTDMVSYEEPSEAQAQEGAETVYVQAVE